MPLPGVKRVFLFFQHQELLIRRRAGLSCQRQHLLSANKRNRNRHPFRKGFHPRRTLPIQAKHTLLRRQPQAGLLRRKNVAAAAGLLFCMPGEGDHQPFLPVPA